MAEKKKTSDKQAPSADEIEDAVVLNTPEESVPSDTQAKADEKSEAELADVADETRTEAAYPAEVVTSDPEPDQPAPNEPSIADSETADEKPEDVHADVEEPATQTQPLAKQTETVVVRKGGFIPMLLGGVAAAAIGFGLARSGVLEGMPLPGLGMAQDQMTELSERIAAQDGEISDLVGRLAALESAPPPELPDMPDPAPMIEDLSTQIGVLAQRIDALESRPATGAAAADPGTQAALDAAVAELDQIRQALDAQRSEIAALSDAALQEEEAARLTARGAMQRAALARIQTALDAGTPFAEALTDLRDSGVDVPQPLNEKAEEGVVTLAALQASFPDLARDTLRAVRQENGGTGIGGFLETQLGLRSLQPKEGDDPDAVLSRAEAALRTGSLAEALTELDALPESAAAILTEWRTQAETRLAALAAAQDLAQALNTN